jgi:hypothetical protein
MLTGTPECNPTPEVSTGLWTVVSNLKVILPHLKLPLQQTGISQFNCLMQKDL